MLTGLACLQCRLASQALGFLASLPAGNKHAHLESGYRLQVRISRRPRSLLLGDGRLTNLTIEMSPEH